MRHTVINLFEKYYATAKKILECRKCKGCITKINRKKYPEPAYIGDYYYKNKTKVLVVVHNPLIGNSKFFSLNKLNNYQEIKNKYLRRMEGWRSRPRIWLIKLNLALNMNITSKEELSEEYHKNKENLKPLYEYFAWTNLVKCDLTKVKKSDEKEKMYSKCPKRFLFHDVELLKPEVILICGPEPIKYISKNTMIQGIPSDLNEYYLKDIAGDVYLIRHKNKKYLCGIMGHPYSLGSFTNDSIIKLAKNIKSRLKI